MRVRLLAVDSLIPNVALMKLATWHRAQGDDVAVYSPLWDRDIDLLYASRLFDYGPAFEYWPDCRVVRGGPGYNLTSLPCPDSTYPDYDLYGCGYAIGRVTRGCPRRCPWCLVWHQDGNRVRQVAELGDFLRGQTHLRLLDDNLTAMPELFLETCARLAELKTRVRWEALDIRLMDDAMCEALLRVRRWGHLHFAWDSIAEGDRVLAGLRRLKRLYPSLDDVAVYVLVGFDTTPEEDMYRLEALRALGASPFVMPYRKDDPYQRALARWVNRPQLFKSVPWAEYRDGQWKGAADAR